MCWVFFFVGMMFEEYNGLVMLLDGSSECLIFVGEGIVFLFGMFDIFIIYGGLVNLLEIVNIVGLLFYVC